MTGSPYRWLGLAYTGHIFLTVPFIGLVSASLKDYKIEQHEDSYTVPGTSHSYDRRFDFLPIGGEE